MKKVIFLLLLVTLLLGLSTADADAGCATFAVRRAVVSYGHSYVAPTYAYVAPVVNYGYAGYYNAGYDPQQALIKDQAAFIKLQTEAYQQLRLQFSQRPAAAGEAPGPGQEGFASFEAFANQRCIQCHQDGTAKATETGFIMFEKDGKISPFSVPERRRMATLIERGEMPPGNQLGQAERQAAKLLLTKK